MQLNRIRNPYKTHKPEDLPENGRVPVEEVRGQVQHDRKLGQLFQESPARDGRVVGGAAADQEEPAATLDLRNELLDASEGDHLLLKVDPASHGVDDRLWLLEDFLLHEGGVVALHDLLDLHLEGGDLAVDRAVVVQGAGHAVNGQDTCRHQIVTSTC